MAEPDDVLNEYEDIYLSLSDLQVELERARKEAIPPEVQEALQAVEAKYKPKMEALQESLKAAELKLKNEVYGMGITLSGNVITAIYKLEPIKWDDKHLLRLAKEYPRILEALLESKPSVTIQRIK